MPDTPEQALQDMSQWLSISYVIFQESHVSARLDSWFDPSGLNHEEGRSFGVTSRKEFGQGFAPMPPRKAVILRAVFSIQEH
jgi:hypothetical protein